MEKKLTNKAVSQKETEDFLKEVKETRKVLWKEYSKRIFNTKEYAGSY
jgi:hypothetical protein